jgi:hypothetical protein
MLDRRKVVAQNSLSVVDLQRAESQKMVFFATANTGSMPHWLRQVRIATHVDESGNMKSISAQSMGSSQVRLTIITYHSCNRMSCLGCKSTRLQALCYASQQCAVVKCVGTVVNQNRPLCNIGLVMASYAETSLLMMMGAWIIFTETYGKILDAALIGPQNTLQLEWVDDAFFGYVCSAKDTFGQMTSVITSSIGAGIVTGYNNKRRMAAVIDDGGSSFAQDDGFTASVTILLNGVNAFLYQLASFFSQFNMLLLFFNCNLSFLSTDFQPWQVLFPLYSLIAMQKTIVCTSNDIFALFDVTDFKIRLGRPDLQMASDLSAGVCMTKFFDAQMDASMETGVENDFVSGLNQFMESSGQLRGTIKAGSFSGLGKRVTRIVTLATSKLEASGIRPSYINTGGKRKPMFDRLQNNNMVKRLGAVMGKVQLTAPIHAIDSTLTYMMGVVSGLEDMAQVRIF